MAQTNKALLINASSTQFQSGGVIPSDLLPSAWSAVSDQYYKEMRRQNLDSTFDWGSKNFSVILPRSLNAISNCYLRIDLQDLSDASHAYKFSRGKYIIQNFSFRSNGVEVYRCTNYPLFLRSWEESLDIEELRAWRDTFMGCPDAGQRKHEGTTVYIPLALPNARVFRYPHTGGVKFGCLPCRFGNSCTEVVISLHESANLVLDASHTVPSIQNHCSLQFREIVGRSSFINSFSEGRGSYSIAVPERISLISEYVNCSAGVKHTFKNLSCNGNVFCLEFECLAQGDTTHVENDVMTTLSFLEVRLDNEVVMHQDQATIKLNKYSSGYRTSNSTLTIMPRVQFNNNGTRASASFQGAVDFRNIQNMDVEVSFTASCKVKVYSMRYSRVILTSAGQFKKYLD